jgi:hypothetical protein
MAYGYAHAHQRATAHQPAQPLAEPPPPPPFPERRRAPLSVHAAATLLYLGGLALILAAATTVFLMYGGDAAADVELPPRTREWLAELGLPTAAVLAVAGLFAYAVARRLQRGRRWARILVLVFCAVSLASNLFSLVTNGTAEVLSGLVLPVLYLVLLNTTAARRFFRGY